MLISEMIEQTKVKKGYINKSEQMRIKLFNLTLVADSKSLMKDEIKKAANTKKPKEQP